MGLIFVVFGLNGFFNFIPVPPMEPGATNFIMALVGTGYMMPWIKVIEIACGVCFMAGCYVPLALIAIAPILLNIFAFHLFLDAPKNLLMPILLLAAWGTLVYLYRSYFSPLFRPK